MFLCQWIGLVNLAAWVAYAIMNNQPIHLILGNVLERLLFYISTLVSLQYIFLGLSRLFSCGFRPQMVWGCIHASFHSFIQQWSSHPLPNSHMVNLDFCGMIRGVVSWPCAYACVRNMLIPMILCANNSIFISLSMCAHYTSRSTVVRANCHDKVNLWGTWNLACVPCSTHLESVVKILGA